jgi:hypothetical protein
VVATGRLLLCLCSPRDSLLPRTVQRARLPIRPGLGLRRREQPPKTPNDSRQLNESQVRHWMAVIRQSWHIMSVSFFLTGDR